jgi:hypothetical protein
MKYKPFKHKITEDKVTFLSDDFFDLSEFDQFLSQVEDDEYLCGIPQLKDGEIDPLAKIEVIKHGKMDETILQQVYKSLDR